MYVLTRFCCSYYSTFFYLGDPLFGTGTTRLSTIRVSRGLSWEEVLNRLPTEDSPLVSENEGLYLSLKGVKGKLYCLLVLSTTDPGAFVVYRPNIGRVNALMRYSDLQQTYRKVCLLLFVFIYCLYRLKCVKYILSRDPSQPV